jgi:hypothetical protein
LPFDFPPPPDLADIGPNINLDNPTLNLYTDEEIWWLVEAVIRKRLAVGS